MMVIVMQEDTVGYEAGSSQFCPIPSGLLECR